MTTFEIIKNLCAKRNITLYRLEKDCGLSINSILKWQNSSPKADNLQKIADYFDVSVDYLLGRTDNPTPSQQGIELPGVYLRLAKEAQELGLDEEDVDHILAIYRRHEKE